MPYQRSMRFETPAVAWQDIVLLQAAPQWSDNYQAASPRLLLPAGGALGCEVNGARFVCDSLSGLWLTSAQNYRLRQPQALQHSTVLRVHDEAVPWKQARRAALPLQAHLQLARWRSALQHDRVEALALEEGLLALLQTVLGTAADGKNDKIDKRDKHRAVERAREHLAAQPQQQHTLAQIAAVACCSPFHLARQFRRCTGSSLHAYRTRLRMALALQRMEQGQTDLTALALDLGYSSHSHFSATFSQHFGCAPGQLRTNLTAPRRH